MALEENPTEAISAFQAVAVAYYQLVHVFAEDTTPFPVPAAGPDAFGPVVEQVVLQGVTRSGIDLDAGIVRGLLGELDNERRYSSWEEPLIEAGVDLAMFPADSPPMPLHGLNLPTVHVDDADWNIHPDDLADRFKGIELKRNMLLWGRDNSYPATYLVRTHQGGLGVLQVLAPADGGMFGWAICHKKLRRSLPQERAG